ncbi:acetolactate synthase-1/2/3 large subunit [Pseudonocardia hierapolitana]|uniref:Acetolactate synthase-1/2/3 large subunit n=1 Tax=Pseudonocardia hierapolitana TaxID=1128676 RepID=A0A561SRL4_9PSEU|nr:thiamine pyrophosphate-dependent enzyme [Pseudonocardia hierapolitana]TWF77485.1 acetolactate synthase-1/2/3 large subunit [Pseudonocardia hierapolitana]
MTTVAAAVADLLAEAGARRCYTVPGESFLSLIDEVDRHAELRLVSVRHESGAAFMADADARLTGVPAVAMASRGPGSSNLAIGVHTAHQDSTPMIVLLGQVDSQLRGREAFQEVDLTAFYGPITKWAVTAERAEDVPGLVEQGWRIATSGRPGPVAIAIPSDFVDAEAELQHGHLHATSLHEGGHAAITAEELATRLLAAQRPVAIAGEGARPARDLLVAAAERFGIGVCTSFRRQDAFPVDHPNFLGHLALATPDATVDAVAGADLLLVVGTRLDEVTTQRYRLPAPGTEVVPVGRYGIGGIDADPADVLAALARWGGPDRRVDWSQVHAAVDAWSTPPKVDADAGVHPAAVIAALHRHLPHDGIVTNDAGNFAAFLHRYWRFPPTTTQLAPVNGAMGYAVPAAVAAAVAAPERTAVAVVGDGGVLMTGQEIETAVRLGAPVVVLVMQNGMYGTIAMHQARDLGRTSGVEIGAVDLVRWAEGLGAAAYGVTEAGELDEALHRAVTGRRPAVVAVRTDPDIITPTATLAGLLERVPV